MSVAVLPCCLKQIEPLTDARLYSHQSSRLVKASTDKIRAEQQTATSTLQSLSNTIHSRELELAQKQQEEKDRNALEGTQRDLREQINTLEARTKVWYSVIDGPLALELIQPLHACRSSTRS